MKLFKNKLIMLFIISATSCITEMPIQQHVESDQKLTLSALLESGGDFRVKIGASTSITALDTPWIDNATVLLWENGVLVDTLESEGNGSYYSPVFISRGTVFTIEAHAGGFETITATDTVPDEEIRIHNVQENENDYMDSHGDLYNTYLVDFKDAESKNFYEFFFIRTFMLNDISYIDFIWSEDIIDPLIKSESSNEIFKASIIFNDHLFSGNEYVLKIIDGSSYQGKGLELFDFDPGNYMVLRNTSSAYYKFRQSLAAHLYNQQQKIDFEDYSSFLFDSNPEPLFSNVKNGYGIFAFYTQDAYKLPTDY